MWQYLLLVGTAYALEVNCSWCNMKSLSNFLTLTPSLSHWLITLTCSPVKVTPWHTHSPHSLPTPTHILPMLTFSLFTHSLPTISSHKLTYSQLFIFPHSYSPKLSPQTQSLPIFYHSPYTYSKQNLSPHTTSNFPYLLFQHTLPILSFPTLFTYFYPSPYSHSLHTHSLSPHTATPYTHRPHSHSQFPHTHALSPRHNNSLILSYPYTLFLSTPHYPLPNTYSHTLILTLHILSLPTNSCAIPTH